jgi:UDP:flavonoid glycosyltransferase YjiC (YdhE family)
MVTGRRGSKRILLLAYPWGASHAQRCLSIGQELACRYHDIEAIYATGGPNVRLIREAGADVDGALRYEPIPVVDGYLDKRRMRRSFTRCELQYALQGVKLFYRYRPDAILLDEMIVPPLIVRFLGPKVIYLTHAPVFPSPLPGSGIMEIFSNATINALRRLTIRLSDISFYMGSREHLPDSPSWPWVVRHTQVVDVLRTKRLRRPSREQARQLLGVPDGASLIVVTVGGTNMGGYLLRAAVDAVPFLTVPDPLLILICGPALDSANVVGAASPSVRVVPTVNDLTEYLVAADVAVIQAGVTTIRECAALGTPMICVPVKWHREQENNARHAAEEFGAQVIRRDELTPQAVASKISAAVAGPRGSTLTSSRVRLDRGRVAVATEIARILQLNPRGENARMKPLDPTVGLHPSGV